MLSRYPFLAGWREAVTQAVVAICQSHRSGNQVMVCGNGGSASDAEHIVGELVKQFKLPRYPDESQKELLKKSVGEAQGELLAANLQCGVRAISLVSQTSLTTAVANDTDATFIFAQQVFVYGKPGDVVWGISTSGNSRNVVQALQVAKAFGMTTIGMTGERDCMMDSCCDIILKAPSNETYQVQECHLPMYHAICLMVEEELFGEPPTE